MTDEKHTLSYSADVRYIPPKGKRIRIDATPDELTALAERFKIPGILSFGADVALERAAGGQIRLTGKFDGVVVQTCGVTLEDFEQNVSDTVDVVFQEGRNAQRDDEVVMEMQETFEPLENGKILVGETLIEYFSLAIDPFPRKKDAEFVFENEADEKRNPFAVLEKLKENQKKD